MDLAAGFVLIEALVNKRPQEVARTVTRPRLINPGHPVRHGLGVPGSSLFRVLKNDATSRKAANPIPSTYGSWP